MWGGGGGPLSVAIGLNLCVNIKSETMDANPLRDATKDDVELGNVAYLTPCPSKRRRTVAEAPTQQTRPEWTGASAEGARKDLGASEKKMVRRLYYILEK